MRPCFEGQRANGYWTPDGTLVPWIEATSYPDCYTKEFCNLVNARRANSDADATLYAEAFEQTPYNCLCIDAERCNHCLKPSEVGAVQSCTRQRPRLESGVWFRLVKMSN